MADFADLKARPPEHSVSHVKSVPSRGSLWSKQSTTWRSRRAARQTLAGENEVAYGGGLGEEWVVPCVELDDAARASGELALQVGGSTSVLDADEVRRRGVLPGR
jgi:hypothetical protein